MNFSLTIPDQFTDIFAMIREQALLHDLDAYAVGGFVRDIILKRPTNDIDILVDGAGNGIKLAEIIAKKFHLHPPVIYPEFGTAMIHFAGNKIEFVHPRKEKYERDSRNPITEPTTIQEDAARRDFTINTLMLRLENLQAIDPTGLGIKDLENKTIRCANIKNPDASYQDDPLRMFRAIRFCVQLGFNINVQTFHAIEHNHFRCEILARERIHDEFNKIMLSPIPHVGINMMMETFLLREIIPEIYDMPKTDQDNRWHKFNVYLHTMEVLEHVEPILELRLAALFHDIGKPRTKTVDQTGIHFYKHDMVGAQMTEEIMRRLKYSNEHIETVVWLVENHMRFHNYRENSSDKSIRKLIRDAGTRLDALMKLNYSDLHAHRLEHVQPFIDHHHLLKDRIREVELIKPSLEITSILDGNQLIQKFGKEPGPWIKAIKERLVETQLENPALTEEEAWRIAQEEYNTFFNILPV